MGNGEKMRRPLLFTILLALSVLMAVTTVEEESSAQVPPSVIGVKVLNVGEDYFEIKWETSTPTKCTVEWGKTKEYGQSKELTGSFDSYFRTNITGLDRTTKYHYRIVAEDLSGEVGQSGDFTVITGPQDEVDEGTPGWVWGIVSVLIIVLLVYLLLLRPAARG
jgi:hypothetical protein